MLEHARCRERARGAHPLLPDGWEGTPRPGPHPGAGINHGTTGGVTRVVPA
jgi:hypothetical protein